MAERPIFMPVSTGPSLVREVTIEFKWHPGMAPSQKLKNVIELHRSAAARGLSPLLEVSSKSEHELGRRMSAFVMPIRVGGKQTTVECAFQGSKVFRDGGPYEDLYWVSSREAKRDERLHHSGPLIGFSLLGDDFPLVPKTAFYDWLYLNALYPHRGWLNKLEECVGFTDIEFNPLKSLNCQARSCAIFISLLKRDLLDEAMESFGIFIELAYVEDARRKLPTPKTALLL